MFKSNKGFTLVELIVVIAILAILAGVAIPVYNGYIKRAQDASVVTELDAIATAAQAANATEGGIDLIVVSADGKSIKVSGAVDNTVSKNFNEDFILFYGKAGVTAVPDKYGQFTINDVNKIDMAGSYTGKGANWTEDDGWQTGVVSIDDNKIPGATQNPSTNPPVEEEEEEKPETITHHWDAGTVTTKATCSKDGVMTYSCTDEGCSETKTESYKCSGTDNNTDMICDECKESLLGDNDAGGA